MRFTIPTRGESGLGLSGAALAALAVLGVPRVVLHDLELGGGAANALPALLVPVVWVAVVVRRAVPRPFAALVVVGLLYGAMLAVTHQILWAEAYDGDPPRLGDRLAEAPDWVHSVVTRAGAVLSSVGVGLSVGAVSGAVAAGIRRSRSRLTQ